MSKRLTNEPDLPIPQGVPELVDRLWRADQDPTAEPLQDADDLRRAREWSVRVLLDTEALLEHVRLLEALYGAAFPFPAVRGDPWAGAESAVSLGADLDPMLRDWLQTRRPVEPPAPVPETAFRPQRPLHPKRALEVVEHGVERLNPTELAALLLSPFVLCDLAERIDLRLPAYWLPEMARIGHALMRHHGLEPPPRHTVSPKAQPRKEDTGVELRDKNETPVDFKNPGPR
jgi:hypothetical protein